MPCSYVDGAFVPHSQLHAQPGGLFSIDSKQLALAQQGGNLTFGSGELQPCSCIYMRVTCSAPVDECPPMLADDCRSHAVQESVNLSVYGLLTVYAQPSAEASATPSSAQTTTRRLLQSGGLTHYAALHVAVWPQAHTAR